VGAWFNFHCPSCDYSAEVSGGDDWGMVARVQTRICESCRNLVDVYMGPALGACAIEDYDIKCIESCPECGSNQTKKWPKSRPCPRCGARMRKGEITALWD
jgi:hypothetical protein